MTVVPPACGAGNKVEAPGAKEGICEAVFRPTPEVAPSRLGSKEVTSGTLEGCPVGTPDAPGMVEVVARVPNFPGRDFMASNIWMPCATPCMICMVRARFWSKPDG